jgi:hypothetical protein
LGSAIAESAFGRDRDDLGVPRPPGRFDPRHHDLAAVGLREEVVQTVHHHIHHAFLLRLDGGQRGGVADCFLRPRGTAAAQLRQAAQHRHRIIDRLVLCR